ncbi:MAG: 3'-5' exonuclease, partial [Candidatus Margulisbacteria bacterium]|nr:3'-5' exonuclease [Candidatus Margulisiibacteriota bacterium]
MDFVVVDIETTGLAPDINEIIEIGAVRLQKKNGEYEITARYDQLVKPYHDIPAVVRGLTGITARTVERAPRFKEIAGDFRRFVGGAVFVAHNALFDLRMINASFERLDQPPFSNPALDTQDMVAIAFPAQASHRLGDLVKSLGVATGGDLHRALADAEATAGLLLKTFAAIAALPPELSAQLRRLLKNHKGIEKEILEM